MGKRTKQPNLVGAKPFDNLVYTESVIAMLP